MTASHWKLVPGPDALLLIQLAMSGMGMQWRMVEGPSVLTPRERLSLLLEQIFQVFSHRITLKQFKFLFLTIPSGQFHQAAFPKSLGISVC